MSVRARLVVVFAVLLAACGPGQSESVGTSETSTESGTADTDSSESESSSESSESETGDELECLLAIRIDLCCNQPYPAQADELDADPCVVAWPIDWDAIPDDIESSCGMAQPDWCEVVDCEFAEPPTELVEPDGMGGCAWLCPTDTYPAYREPGCGQPPPVVECLGIPPPCADEYCSCAGETIYGCGQVSEPFADFGPC